MIVKMLTHIHMVVYTWWCWHIYKGGGVCRVEMGLGPYAFGKMECLFSIAPDENSWWLAYLSKGEEVRVEMELVEMMLASVY